MKNDDASSANSPWHVAVARRRGMKRAVRELERAGFEVYVPYTSYYVRQRNAKVLRIRPQLYRYFFVRGVDVMSAAAAIVRRHADIEPDAKVGDVAGDGAATLIDPLVGILLDTDGKPATVGKDVLAHFRHREKRQPTFYTYARRALVEAVSGPLQGRQGHVQRCKPHKGTVRVDFGVVGVVEMALRDVAPA